MKQYGDELARELSHSLHASVAALTDIDGIPPDDRADAMTVACSAAADPSNWIYISLSTGVAGSNCRVPTDAPSTGRWHRINSGSSAVAPRVRNIVVSNVASLTAYTVTSATLNDNVSGGNVAGDRIGLFNQTTGTEDGIYVVGTVTGSTAPLTRATDWALATVQPAGTEIAVDEGTIFGKRKWFASLVGAITVGTSSPAFYPRKYERITTAMAGTPGVKALTAEWILSATKSSVTPVVKVPGTQGFLSIGALSAAHGTGSFTVTSTANETSTLQIVIEN